jgi:hypothetical protein
MRYAVLVLLVPAVASADRKSFTNTYEYATLPEGQTEVEIWHTQARDTWDKSTPQRFEEKIEIEHGITDNWDASMYTVFSEVAGNAMTSEPLALDGVRFETRYRFADRGQWPVDTVAYLEVAKDFGAGVYELEGKGIFARDFDRITAAANIIGEVQIGHDVPDSTLELGWAAGVTYEITPKVRLGAETWGAYEDSITRAAAGPAVSLAPSSKFWLAMTAGFGLATLNGDEAAGSAFSGRIIMGLEL